MRMQAHVRVRAGRPGEPWQDGLQHARMCVPPHVCTSAVQGSITPCSPCGPACTEVSPHGTELAGQELQSTARWLEGHSSSAQPTFPGTPVFAHAHYPHRPPQQPLALMAYLQHLPQLAQKRIILASASPRRKELLGNLGFKFEAGIPYGGGGGRRQAGAAPSAHEHPVRSVAAIKRCHAQLLMLWALERPGTGCRVQLRREAAQGGLLAGSVRRGDVPPQGARRAGRVPAAGGRTARRPDNLGRHGCRGSSRKRT